MHRLKTTRFVARFPGRRLVLLPFLLLILLTLPTRGIAADQPYIVKRNDTLYGIAKRHGISTTELAERNGLKPTAWVYVGQRLSIPTKGAKSSSTTTSALPQSIQNAIAKAKVKSGRWRYIVIHHSGVDEGTMKGMDEYHRDVRHMEHGLAYHFVIGNGHGMGDGEIGVSERWTGQLNGGHLASETQNRYSIGICLVGNFETSKPTPKQIERLTALIQALMKRCSLPRTAVKTHRKINVVGTKCPGRNFPETDHFIKTGRFY